MKTIRTNRAATLLAAGGFLALAASAWAGPPVKGNRSAYVPSENDLSPYMSVEAAPRAWSAKGNRSAYVPEECGAIALTPAKRTSTWTPVRAKGQRSEFIPTIEPASLSEAVEKIVATWSCTAAAAAKKTVERYGLPDQLTPGALVWNNVGPWKRVVAYRAQDTHRFPQAHFATLEQVVNYRVPEGKFPELGRLHNGLIVRSSSGELASLCESEAMNFLALNLAHDIVVGSRTVEEARDFMARTTELSMSGKSSPYMERLLFVPDATSGSK